MAGRRLINRSKPSSIERESGNPRSSSGTSSIYAAIAKKAQEKKAKEAKAKAAKDKAAKELKQKNAQAAEDKRLKLAAQKEANELARAEAEVNSRRQREDASRRMIQMAEASAKKAKDKKAKEAADKKIAEAKAKAEELAAKRAEAEKRRADKEAAAAKAAKEREAKAAADKASIAAANKAAEEKAAKQAARLEQIRIFEEREQFRRGQDLQARQEEAKRIREAKAAADAKAKAAADAKAAEDKRIADAKAAAEAKAAKERADARAAKEAADKAAKEANRSRAAKEAALAKEAADKAAAAKAAADAKKAADAKAAEDKRIADAKAAAEAKRVEDANREVKTVDFTPDQLVDKFNNSPGAQDFNINATYDPKTNTFVEDVSAFGFEGDAATNTYTPEEFMTKLGYKGDEYNKLNFVQPEAKEPENSFGTPAPDPSTLPSLDSYDSKEVGFVEGLLGHMGAQYDDRQLLEILNNQFGDKRTLSPDTMDLLFFRPEGEMGILQALDSSEFGTYADHVNKVSIKEQGQRDRDAANAEQDPAPTPPDTPVSSVPGGGTGITYDETGSSAPKGNEDPSLQNTVAPMWAAQSPDFKFTAEPIPRINPAWKGLEEWKAQQQDPAPTPPDAPVSSTDDDSKVLSFFSGQEYDPDPKLNSLYNSLSDTIQMSAGTRALTQEEAAQRSKEVKDLEQQIIASGGQPYKYFTNLPFGGFRGEGPDPTRGEYDPMTGRYTDKDDQTSGLDDLFSNIPDPGPAPTPPDMPGSPIDDLISKIPDLDDIKVTDQEPAPTPPDMPGSPIEEGPRDGPKMGPPPPGFTHHGGISTMALVPFFNPTTGEEWTAPNGGWSPGPGWGYGTKPADWKPPTSADPAPTLPDMPGPDPLPESPAPKPPTFVDMDPLKGMRDQFVPRNILGQSYDPQVREDFVRQMQSGANITSTPSYQMPTSPIPQTQFGGYGQPMPMSPLAPYAGLGAAPRPPIDYYEPYDEDALPGGPSGPRDGGGVT